MKSILLDAFFIGYCEICFQGLTYICDMKSLLVLCVTLCMGHVFCQEDDSVLSRVGLADSLSIQDTNYREDQFYVGVTYNLLGYKATNVTQNGFSSGIHFGFIRDFPVNRRRNVAIGLGVGFSGNSYNQNLLISEIGDDYTFTVLDDISFSRNRFSTYLVEIPLEFRWRTSTVIEYDFWRVYSGFKFGYVFYNTAKYRGDPENSTLTNISDMNTIQYGLTLSVGYSNVNFHLYYGLNTIFNKDAYVSSTGERIDMKAIKIGLMFYIL